MTHASLTEEQARLVVLLSPCADRWACLKTIYIFGSVARGDNIATSDLDLAFEYLDDLERDNAAMASFTEFQRGIEVRKRHLERLVGRVVSLHGVVIDYRGEDGAFPAIRDAARQPVAAAGKIVVAATQRTKT